MEKAFRAAFDRSSNDRKDVNKEGKKSESGPAQNLNKGESRTYNIPVTSLQSAAKAATMCSVASLAETGHGGAQRAIHQGAPVAEASSSSQVIN